MNYLMEKIRNLLYCFEESPQIEDLKGKLNLEEISILEYKIALWEKEINRKTEKNLFIELAYFYETQLDAAILWPNNERLALIDTYLHRNNLSIEDYKRFSKIWSE